VPSGNGLPGTGEAPTSGLRRVTAGTAGPTPTSDPDPQPGAGSAQARASAEELRRRLGGFQRGLRQAAQESAAATGAAQPAELVQEQDR
jgi:hypothetical protein